MLRAIIIDDEPRGRSILQQLLALHAPQLNIVGIASNADEGLQIIDTHKPDIVFLDVEMPGKSGFELLRELNTIDFKVVFVSAHNHYSLKAIKFHAFDYLLKPIDLDELKQTIEKLLRSSQAHTHNQFTELLTASRTGNTDLGKIAISSLSSIDLINVDDILYCEASANNTLVYLTNNKKIVATKNLKEYEDLLLSHRFFRIHHAYLVNLKHVARYIKGEGGSVILSNQKELEVSRRKKQEFLNALQN
ncbi:LytR/AlgR family response regulator transcription factor [Ferruginibacter sp. SUN106]|uniref:LytR/AlgR family response regulator transcription factor n=1 Tax=Ferruginibacter sp. SUN106 TaxID=2978348 RepID=UPI003D365FF8